MLTYSNPRLVAEFADWPSGGNRVQCRFACETGSKGMRVSRTTTNKFGVWCKPKTTTYCVKCCICDGSDGKTYILEYSHYGFVSVLKHDFFQAEAIHTTQPERLAACLALINQAVIAGR